MKLHWSPKSPYVRKVMISAHETGVASKIELVRTVVAMTNVNPAIMADNPLGKIPTLVLDDGQAIFDSLVICSYFDEISVGPTLFPSGKPRWDALTRHALGQGLTDALILWRNELNREKAIQLPSLLASMETKVDATLDNLEAQASRFSLLPFDIGHVAIGTALSYADFRFEDLGWRHRRPSLAAWHETFCRRPSSIATAITDG